MNTIDNFPPEVQQEFAKHTLKATEKLFGGIGKVLGYFFEPKHLKAMADAEAYKTKTLADAKAYEIEIMGKAVRNNQDLPIDFKSSDNTLTIDITNHEQLIERSNIRLQYQQARKERNIVSVIGKAVLELGDKTVDTDSNIDEDWLTRFFNIVEDVSDEQLQNLWARILAGEILVEKSYSLRVLEFLKNISKDELDIILKVMPFITGKFIFNDSSVLKKYDIPYGLILKLDELGVVNSSGMISNNINFDENSCNTIFQTESVICTVTNKSKSKKEFNIPVFSVNEIGLKLKGLSNTSICLDFVKDVLSSLADKNNGIYFSLNEIQSITDDEIYCNDVPLFEVGKNKK